MGKQNVEYYIAIKRSEVLNLENIMVSERSQTQKGTYCVIPFIGTVPNGEIHEDRKETHGCQWLWGEGS